MPRLAAFFVPISMHLLYLDDSGSTKNPADRHVILAGVAVFERLPFWFSRELDQIAGQLWQHLRGAVIRQFKGHADDPICRSGGVRDPKLLRAGDRAIYGPDQASLR